jgi:2-amino-4-hydroxy-6-hydroxymethyldihydropteridine diphosphokinase
MVTCFIGIGSNVGDRLAYIQAAVKKIKMLNLTKVRRLSKVIESKPQGGPPQGPYLNAVVEIETELSPYQLLAGFQAIESGLGRIRTVPNAPRTIDLDILTFGEVSLNEAALCIPHPRIMERDFVLGPMRELCPDVIKALSKKQKAVKKRSPAKAPKAKRFAAGKKITRRLPGSEKRR